MSRACARVGVVGVLLAALFGCGGSQAGEPYRFYVVESSEPGVWHVEQSGEGAVDAVEEADDPAFVFTGTAAGNVHVVLFHAPADENATAADNAYALDLQVDRRLNVTEPEPRYGSYTVQPHRRIAGAERHIRVSNERTVHWYHRVQDDPLSGDGMSDQLDAYTFTGRAPGTVDVEIYDILGWAEGEQLVESFTLSVDDAYRVTRVD